MKFLKGQIYARSWPARLMETAKTAIVGIFVADDISCHDNDLEKIKGYISNKIDDTKIHLVSSGYEKSCRGIKTLDASSILTNQEWPRPAKGTMLKGGGLLFRKIDAKIDGAQLFIVLGVFDMNLCQDHLMWDISGKTETCLVLSNPRIPDFQTQGESLGCVLKMPVWGWDEEKFGLTHSVHVDTAKMCERYDLLEMGMAIEKYEGEFTELESAVKRDMYFHQNDKTFQSFRKIMIQEKGSSWSRAIETKSQKLEFSNRSIEIIKQLT